MVCAGIWALIISSTGCRLSAPGDSALLYGCVRSRRHANERQKPSANGFRNQSALLPQAGRGETSPLARCWPRLSSTLLTRRSLAGCVYVYQRAGAAVGDPVVGVLSDPEQHPNLSRDELAFIKRDNRTCAGQTALLTAENRLEEQTTVSLSRPLWRNRPGPC